jgi:glycosidase
MKRKLLMAVLLLLNLAAIANEIRVEPASWWIGMKNPSLQLMVYGKNISELNPVITNNGIRVTSVTRTDNNNYLFINLVIDKEQVRPGTIPIHFQKNNHDEIIFPFELLERKNGSSLRQGFNQSDVIYLITPDRFANGDRTNDKVPGMMEGINRQNENGRHGGDLQGILNHLDYISNMGFTSLWLTPILENNQQDYSYHGYSITDFYHVDPRMGTNELYKKVTEEASAKGIKMIMDMVFNHCGSGHWWMKDLPAKDWINYADAPQFTNHRKTVLQDPHVAKMDSVLLVDGWFAKTMPDLNQKNPLLATYLVQNTLWWIEYAGLSGVRVDTYPYPDMYFMSEWSKQVLNEYPNLNIVGEEWTENPAFVSYWQKGKINRNGYVSWLPSLMDFPVQASLIKALTEKEKYNSGGLYYLYEMLANDFQYPDADNLVVFADNHDIERFYSLVNQDYDLFKLGISFVLTSRGIPQLYYGTEALLTGESHGRIRSDMPGGWAGDKANVFNSTGLTTQQAEAQQFVKTLLQWRKGTEVLKGSKLLHYRPRNEMYVYFRYNNKGKVMVILNKNSENQKLDLSQFADIIGKAGEGKDIIHGSTVKLKGELDIPAKTPVIIEFKNQ